MAAALTPARLRVLTSAAEGHIRRSDLQPMRHVHENTWRRPCECGFRNHEFVDTADVDGLAADGLIVETADSSPWLWRPTSAGLAALGRNPT